MHPLALLPEQADEFDGFSVGAGEPMGCAGVEFRGFASAEFEVFVAQHQPQPSVEDVKPFVAFVHTRIGLGAAGITSEHHLEGLQTTRAARERNSRHAAMGDGPQVNSRIPGGRGADQIIKGNTVQPCQGQQDVEVRPALAGFQPGQGADRYSGGGGHFSEGEIPFRTECPKPGPDSSKNIIKLMCHTLQFATTAKSFASFLS